VWRRGNGGVSTLFAYQNIGCGKTCRQAKTGGEDLANSRNADYAAFDDRGLIAVQNLPDD
jgi:hypothetical protein